MNSDWPTILLIDDDKDFHFLMQKALNHCSIPTILISATNGTMLEEIGLAKYEGPGTLPPYPELILLDLHMPKKNGVETLSDIKGHPNLKNIPIVVLSTSNHPKEEEACLKLGADSFVQKPMGFKELVALTETFRKYLLPKRQTHFKTEQAIHG